LFVIGYEHVREEGVNSRSKSTCGTLRQFERIHLAAAFPCHELF